jgi:hypothetical protein
VHTTVKKCNIQNFKRQVFKDTVLYHHEVKTKKVSNFKMKHETEADRKTVYGHQIMLHPQETTTLKENQTLELRGYGNICSFQGPSYKFPVVIIEKRLHMCTDLHEKDTPEDTTKFAEVSLPPLCILI